MSSARLSDVLLQEGICVHVHETIIILIYFLQKQIKHRQRNKVCFWVCDVRSAFTHCMSGCISLIGILCPDFCLPSSGCLLFISLNQIFSFSAVPLLSYHLTVGSIAQFCFCAIFDTLMLSGSWVFCVEICKSSIQLDDSLNEDENDMNYMICVR